MPGYFRIRELHAAVGLAQSPKLDQILERQRASIPCFRDSRGLFDAGWTAELPVLIHLGLYAYRRECLAAFAGMPPGRLEQVEKLEMLRVLEQGRRIAGGDPGGVECDAVVGKRVGRGLDPSDNP